VTISAFRVAESEDLRGAVMLFFNADGTIDAQPQLVAAKHPAATTRKWRNLLMVNSSRGEPEWSFGGQEFQDLAPQSPCHNFQSQVQVSRELPPLSNPCAGDAKGHGLG
jgi:hypothetical protein